MGTLLLSWRVPLWWEYSFPLRALSLPAPLVLSLLLVAFFFLNYVFNEVKKDSIYSEFGLGLHAPSWYDKISSCHDVSQDFIVVWCILIHYQNIADLHQFYILVSWYDIIHRATMTSTYFFFLFVHFCVISSTLDFLIK
jgi:hypothetical protein